MKLKTTLLLRKNACQRFFKGSATSAMLAASALLMVESSLMATSSNDVPPHDEINISGLQEANHPKSMLPKPSFQEEVIMGVVAAATVVGGAAYAYRTGYFGEAQLVRSESREESLNASPQGRDFTEGEEGSYQAVRRNSFDIENVRESDLQGALEEVENPYKNSFSVISMSDHPLQKEADTREKITEDSTASSEPQHEKQVPIEGEESV